MKVANQKIEKSDIKVFEFECCIGSKSYKLFLFIFIYLFFLLLFYYDFCLL